MTSVSNTGEHYDANQPYHNVSKTIYKQTPWTTAVPTWNNLISKMIRLMLLCLPSLLCAPCNIIRFGCSMIFINKLLKNLS